ncbi:uncharacterized protein BYT42DRAFT_544837 [Radiomyces spectabilis]|uniref:uncharacterized protein n=1 Tax=Radiomyces spectabilis TaxID=64574 RepID=UPI00221E4AAC|nr:uncharacterized protein BYT42DRAFT_544837 [Radiomyces spectabilis]KAI8385043.1 hypothetical protein BYT42DRAFT_544837 [Radiomyces spectabilis]
MHVVEFFIPKTWLEVLTSAWKIWFSCYVKQGLSYKQFIVWMSVDKDNLRSFIGHNKSALRTCQSCELKRSIPGIDAQLLTLLNHYSDFKRHLIHTVSKVDSGAIIKDRALLLVPVADADIRGKNKCPSHEIKQEIDLTPSIATYDDPHLESTEKPIMLLYDVGAKVRMVISMKTGIKGIR